MTPAQCVSMKPNSRYWRFIFLRRPRIGLRLKRCPLNVVGPFTRLVASYGEQSDVARGILRMPSFELVETGLTPDKFVIKGSAHPSVLESAGHDNPVVFDQEPARRSSLHEKKGSFDCLSVRGLNFVNALVDMSGGHAVDVRFLDIHPYQVVVEGWRHPDATLIHYHLVCETSKRAHVRSGDRRQPLNAGDLYRVIHGSEPTIFHGGEGGSLNLIVTLKLPQTSSRQPSEQSSQLMTAKSDPSNQAIRWGAAF